MYSIRKGDKISQKCIPGFNLLIPGQYFTITNICSSRSLHKRPKLWRVSSLAKEKSGPSSARITRTWKYVIGEFDIEMVHR